jgi:cell division protein FtsN
VSENGKTKRKKFLYEFTLSGLVSLFVFTVLIMVWMFILGVLVGRGYRPEAVIPQLAKVLPQEQAPGQAAPQQEGQAPQEQPTLKPEELGFYEDLKGSGKPRAAKPAPAPAKPSAAPNQSQPAPPQPQAAVQPAAAQATAPPVNKPAPAPSQPDQDKGSAASAQTQKFRYIYQVASFKQEDRATLFRDQAKAKGYNTSYVREPVNDEYWYRVLVTLEGTAQEQEKLRSGLEAIGVKNPLLRSKKPL